MPLVRPWKMHPASDAAVALEGDVGVGSLLARLLVNRGATTPKSFVVGKGSFKGNFAGGGQPACSP